MPPPDKITQDGVRATSSQAMALAADWDSASTSKKGEEAAEEVGGRIISQED